MIEFCEEKRKVKLWQEDENLHKNLKIQQHN